jgi:hypothetical protein
MNRFMGIFGLLMPVAFSVPTCASDFSITPTFTDNFHWSVTIGSGNAQINPTLYLARGKT